MEIEIFKQELRKIARESIQESIKMLDSESTRNESDFNNRRSNLFSGLLHVCQNVLGKYQQFVDTNVRVYNSVTHRHMTGIEVLALHHYVELTPLLKEFSDLVDELYLKKFPQEDSEEE